MAESPSKDTKHLRILCFGDSLTAGYYNWGLQYHPYATRLEDRLKQRYPSVDVEIKIDGFPADKVINGSYTSRLESRLSNGTSYDWILILGGTNDIGWGQKPQDIFTALKMIWTKALDTGAKVLAVTVPESGARGAISVRREALNEMILSHRERNLFVADVCAAMPWPDDIAEQDKIWDDGLHFTEKGYDTLGDVVADKLLEILESDAAMT